MGAGRETCSCPECGAVCKGKFAGCVDVWARGPRQVSVRVRPTAEPRRRVRSAPALDPAPALELNHTAASPPAGSGPRRLDDHSLAVVEQLFDKVRMLESTVEALAAKASRPSTQVVQAPNDGRVEAVAKAVAGMAAGLDRLTADVKQIRAVPARVEAIEQRVASQREAGGGTGAGAGTKAMERLAADVARLSVRLDDLSASATKGRKEASAVLEAMQAMSARLEKLDKDRARLEATAGARPAAPSGPDITATLQRSEQRLEQRFEQRLDQVAARVALLDQLAARVKTLEKTESPPAPPDVSAQVQKLAARLSALEARPSAPQQDPGQPGRLSAMEKVLGGLIQSIERLSARVSALDEVPKRLEALETVPAPTPAPADGPPVEKILASMGKRLDRLATQVGELKNLPDRVRAIEDNPDRTESLSRGLGGAIDMIDQLAAQVAAIESSSRSSNGASG